MLFLAALTNNLVRAAGLEPARDYSQRILSPLRLGCIYYLTSAVGASRSIARFFNWPAIGVQSDLTRTLQNRRD